jgi:hypothetical protein
MLRNAQLKKWQLHLQEWRGRIVNDIAIFWLYLTLNAPGERLTPQGSSPS